MNPPNTAPKDKPFLGNFGYPWLQMATWNDVSMKWAVASMEVGLYEGNWTDTYWETELEPESSLLGWLPIPPITPTTTQP